NYGKFISMDFGRIQNVTTLEVLKLNSAMINYFSAIQFLFMALTYLAISFIVDYKISLIIVIFSGIFLLFLKQIKAYYHKLSLKVSASGDKYNSLLIQLLQNFKYLKLTHGFPHFIKKINYFIKAAEDKNYTILKTNAISVSLREPILLLLVLGILVLYYYLNSEITTGALFSLALFYRTLNYIILTQTNFQMFTSFQGSIDNILMLQQELDLNKEDSTTGTDFNFAHKLVFNNVSLKLQNKLILDQVDLTLNKFQTVGIVGRSGAGKTTLANTLSGILSPDDGNITVDGQDIRSINSALFRSNIGYVSQVPVMFNDSFFNNISLWAEKNSATIQKFEDVIAIAQLRELIHGYQEKEDTIVGDNGIILSGGQKQRVSIARELYKSPQILIMDEATSSLDTETENLIRQNIERLHGNITMLIIAHRLSTVENADIIYLIQDGRVLHSGTYEELLQNSTEFRNLAKYQDKMIE
ncbi:MAG TPA: ABC transporter ATP-binding protein, partial [Saprospiraceae bacterium]|nr:ABC transporter ATP-binding protein [Saprospiraceae bacterium]